MMGRGVLAIIGSVLVAVALCGSAAATEFNVSIWFPDAHPLTKYGYIEWAKKVAEASGGELKPKVFTGTVLLPPAGHLTGLRDGIAQVAYHAGTYTPADLPEDNLLAQLAFNYSDYFVAAFATTEMNLMDPGLQAQWKRNGVVYGGGYATPPYRLFCTTKIVTLADIEGKRLRMPGAAHSDWAKSVGAVPVNVSSSEMFSGLEKGQLDCASNAANDLKSRSLWDVAKHTTMIDLGVYWAGFQYAFNPEFWRGLKPAERRLLFDTIADAMVTTGIGYMKAADETIAEAPGHGVTVYDPSAELRQSVTQFSKVARENAIKLGKEKFGLAEPEALISRFETVAAKWTKLLADVKREDAAALTALLKREVYDKIDVDTYGME